MLAKLIKTLGRAGPAADTLPDGVRAYAVGDVHGRLDLLDALLATVGADDAARRPAETVLIFLGDLVDRGPDSAQVIERLQALAASGRRVRFIAGNHEELLLDSVAGDEKALRLFARHGGRETALSYGIGAAEYDEMDHGELGRALERTIPVAHRAFLAGFEDMVALGDYLFVHAGVRPDRPLDAQATCDLRWIRDPFLDHRGRLGKRVVHGHTVSAEPEFRPHRIGIDTGAYRTGVLTALGLEGAGQWLLRTG